MTKLVWGALPRKFERGVSRGVLYPPTGPGVAWNGLTSVKDQVVGGEAEEFFLDGNKYFGSRKLTNFKATLEAISTPLEFDPCDGYLSVKAGFLLTRQPRQSFGLCYRTEIGEGTGYKLHLVYNATAIPESRSFNSFSSDFDVSKKSWVINAVPPAMTGRRPTAHFVLDSTKVSASVMTSIQQALYGTASANPYLLTPSALIAYF